MYRKKLLSSVLLIMILILFTGGCTNVQRKSTPKAVDGVLNLAGWGLDQGVIELDGKWEFYWNRFVDPWELEHSPSRDGYIDLPGSWNGYVINDKALQGNGYATYRLVLKSDKGSRLGLKIPRMFTAYKLWINGDLIASAGTLGKSREEMTPQYLPQVAFFQAREGENEIVIQVSNFYHRSGGILESLSLGYENQILDVRYRNIAYELFLFGSLVIIGIYHLAFFFFRKKDLSPLYFGLFCLFVGVRTLLVGERFLIYLFPGFSWEVAHKLQTITFYLGLPLIVLYFKSIFNGDISSKVVKIVKRAGLLFGGLVVLTPVKMFSVFNPIYQLFAIMIIAYITMVLAKKLYRKEKGMGLIVGGALALIITSLNDIIFLSIWMNDQGSSFLRAFIKTGNLSSVGQLIFVLAQSLALAQKFSDAFVKEEVTTAQLKEVNLNLDALVKKRTEALEKSRQRIEHQKAELEKKNDILHLLSLKDPLTDLWNRRHFDETMQLEWGRALRFERPISLLLIDIDHFKKYNDCYGHKAGDECLMKVTQIIKKSFKRTSDLVARYGGEEFVVIMSETGKDDAMNMAHLLQKSVEELKIPHEVSPVNTCVTVSIGVTSAIPNIKFTSKDLFLTVDTALYQAKANGRNQVAFLPCNY